MESKESEWVTALLRQNGAMLRLGGREAVQHSLSSTQAGDSMAPQHTLHHQLCAGLSHRSAQKERCHMLHPWIHPPDLTEAEIWVSWNHANLPLLTLPKILPIWSLWQISLETKRPRLPLQTDFTQEPTERILQIVTTEKGRFRSSLIKFVLADLFPSDDKGK